MELIFTAAPLGDGGEAEIPFGQCLSSVCVAQEDLNQHKETWTTQHQVLHIPEGSKQRQWLGKNQDGK